MQGNNRSVVVAIIATCAAVAVALAIIMSGQQPGPVSTSARGNEQNAVTVTQPPQQTSTVNAAPSAKTLSGNGFGVVVPNAYADRVALKSSASYERNCGFDLTVDGTTVATIFAEGTQTGEIEWKLAHYELGVANTTQGSMTLGMNLYVGGTGGPTYWGNSQANELVVHALLGLSDTDVFSWIKLATTDGFRGCDAKLLGADSTDTTGVVLSASTIGNAPDSQVSTTPADTDADMTTGMAAFWGIWIGASKNQGEAEVLASEAQSKGFPASVYLTTDWDNLNSEPWYVVSAGEYSSQQAANSTLPSVQAAGYSDAYVKYSGEHK